MSYPPIFQLAKASAQVVALLGSNPLALWRFGRAPQPGTNAYRVPYAVHRLVYGTPENSLPCPPSIELQGIQIDVFAKEPGEPEVIVEALRDSLERDGNVVSLLDELIDTPTGLYRGGFTIEFWQSRQSS